MEIKKNNTSIFMVPTLNIGKEKTPIHNLFSDKKTELIPISMKNSDSLFNLLSDVKTSKNNTHNKTWYVKITAFKYGTVNIKPIDVSRNK